MRSINILKKTLVALTLTLATTGAFTTKAEAKLNKIKVTSPSGKTVRVAKGKKVKLKTTIKILKNKKVKFKSKNPKVARVTAKGIVKGIKKGKTKIVVSSKSNPKIKKTIKVVVYKKAVKKIKLNKKNISLKKNQQFKLVASISPKKNVSKVLSYKSSNKKVATVTKKGIIKAVAAGTAKITVKATDGSKKKATCQVTVKGANENEEDKTPVEIKSVKVRSAFSVDVELNKAKALSYENFTILCKQPGDKEFKDIFEITSLSTSDNIHYEVVVDDTEMINYKSTLKILVNDLDGVKEKEIYVDKIYGFSKDGNYTCRYSDEVNSKSISFFNEVGEQFSYEADFEAFIKADIKKITVSELPKGLTATCSEDNSYVEINGTFAEIAYEYKTVITAIDTYDREIFINCYFYIGDEDTLYIKADDVTAMAYVPPEFQYYNHDITREMGPNIRFSDSECSMSNCTNFKTEGLPDNTYITDGGYMYVKEPFNPVKAGVYNVTISATTPTGKDFTVKYKLTLVDGVMVKGRLTDPAGKPLSGVNIVFENKSVTGWYVSKESDQTDENGYYHVRLFPGIYDVYSSIKNVYNSYSVDFTKDTTLNIKSLCYKIVFVNPALDIVVDQAEGGYYYIKNTEVYDMKGRAKKIWGFSNVQKDDKYKLSLVGFLKKGTYNFGESLSIQKHYENPEQYKILTKQFTVSESCEVKIDLEKVENN